VVNTFCFHHHLPNVLCKIRWVWVFFSVAVCVVHSMH